MKTSDAVPSAPQTSWRVIAASVQGVSHVKADLPCQDAHAYAVLPDGTLLVAVADGAGSAAEAERGAQLAAETAVAYLRQALIEYVAPADATAWRTCLLAAFQTTRQRLEDEAAQHGFALRDLAATLIVLVASETCLVAAHVGDGAAVLHDPATGYVLLSAPQGGEYVNETTFLVSADYLEKTQFDYWPHRATQLAVFTDGLQRLALQLPLGKPHAPFFAPLLQFAQTANHEATVQLTTFLRSPRIAERADDDLTLLLAVRQ